MTTNNTFKKTIVSAICLVTAVSAFGFTAAPETYSQTMQTAITADAATVYTVYSPVENPRYTSYFAEKRTIDGKTDVHTGIDIVPNSGNYSIYAAESGTVYETRNNCSSTKTMSDGYGNYIKVQMPDGHIAIYGHLKKGSVLVKKGDKITAGQKIATMGQSGAAWGTHLHFEMRPSKNSAYGVKTSINVNPTYKGGSVDYVDGPGPEAAFIEGATYRIRSAVGSYYLGTAGNKTASKTNAELVNKNDSSALWVAHYSTKTRSWSFSPKSASGMALNCFADNVQSNTNANLYKVNISDPSQTFVPVQNADGSYVLKCRQNQSVCLEVSGYANKAKKGTNVRLYTVCGDKTQNWFFELEEPGSLVAALLD